MPLKVKDIMTTTLYTLYDTDHLNLSRLLMEKKRIRHIPIINQDEQLIGLLTHRDLLSASVSALAEIDTKQRTLIHQGIPVKNAMRKNIRTVPPELPLQEAAELLIEYKYGCLPVVKDKKLVGIVTESDFVQLTLDLLMKLEAEE